MLLLMIKEEQQRTKLVTGLDYVMCGEMVPAQQIIVLTLLPRKHQISDVRRILTNREFVPETQQVK
jgi:hypothetical protein